MAIEEVVGYAVEVSGCVADAQAAAVEVKSLLAACEAAGPSPVTERQAERALKLARYIDNIRFNMRDAVALGVESAFGISRDEALRVLEEVGSWGSASEDGQSRSDGLSAPQGLIKDHLSFQYQLVTGLAVESSRDAEQAWSRAFNERD